MSARVRIAIVFGGRSGEHEVSCKSAASIMAHLDRDRYDILPIKITTAGDWVVVDRVCGLAAAIRAFRTVDVVFPALHGPYGEDGTIQSLLEFAGVRYVGNGVLASAAGMDKEVTKKLLAADGLRVAAGLTLRGEEDALTPDDQDRLGLPVFVKPVRAGSSLGVSKVTSWADLGAAVALARGSDPKVLVEEAIAGREVDVAVLEHPDGRLVAGPPLEIRISGERGFFDYDAKYRDDSGTVFDIPARLDAQTTALVQEHAIRVFRALDCSGLLRVDFFLPAAGAPIVNEVNTFPGFTAASQYPRIWQVAGLGYPALLDVLIGTALAKAIAPLGAAEIVAVE